MSMRAGTHDDARAEDDLWPSQGIRRRRLQGGLDAALKDAMERGFPETRLSSGLPIARTRMFPDDPARGSVRDIRLLRLTKHEQTFYIGLIVRTGRRSEPEIAAPVREEGLQHRQPAVGRRGPPAYRG